MTCPNGLILYMEHWITEWLRRVDGYFCLCHRLVYFLFLIISARTVECILQCLLQQRIKFALAAPVSNLFSMPHECFRLSKLLQTNLPLGEHNHLLEQLVPGCFHLPEERIRPRRSCFALDIIWFRDGQAPDTPEEE